MTATLHDHSNAWRSVYSVTDSNNKTVAVMKPMTQLRGWWILEGRGICWVNPMARDIGAVRYMAGTGDWPRGLDSMYNSTPRMMLLRGKRSALRELESLVELLNKPTRRL